MQRPWTWTAAMCTIDEPHRGPCGRVTNTIGAATWLRDEVSPSGGSHIGIHSFLHAVYHDGMHTRDGCALRFGIYVDV